MILIKDVPIDPENSEPEGTNPTCPYPNPEFREALQVGLNLCESVQPDLLVATDPDCDRMGIAVRHNGDYQLLNGNEVGVLLLDFIARNRIANGTMPKHPIAVKTGNCAPSEKTREIRSFPEKKVTAAQAEWGQKHLRFACP